MCIIIGTGLCVFIRECVCARALVYTNYPSFPPIKFQTRLYQYYIYTILFDIRWSVDGKNKSGNIIIDYVTERTHAIYIYIYIIFYTHYNV